MSEVESGARQPSRLSRGFGRAKSFVVPGTFLYSITVGAVAGVALTGAAVILRSAKVYFWDEEYLRLQSRKRYLEKQAIFFADLQEKLKAHYIGNVLVREYHAVDTRLPFQAMQDRFRF